MERPGGVLLDSVAAADAEGRKRRAGALRLDEGGDAWAYTAGWTSVNAQQHVFYQEGKSPLDHMIKSDKPITGLVHEGVKEVEPV